MIIRIYLRDLINNMIIHNRMIIRIYLNNKGLINMIIHSKIKCLVNKKDLIHHNNNNKILINQVIYLIILILSNRKVIHGHKIRIYLIISIIIQLIITIKIIYFNNHNKDHLINNHLINNRRFNHHKIQVLIYLIKTKIKINLCRL